VREKLFEAKIKATLQGIIADNALVSCGKDDTTVLTTLISAEWLSLI
jgi:hypothetical protein